MGGKSKLISTARDYAEASSVHGVSYAFNRSQIYYVEKFQMKHLIHYFENNFCVHLMVFRGINLPTRFLPLVDRLLWCSVTLVCLALSVYWSVTNYNDWQKKLTITIVKVSNTNNNEHDFMVVLFRMSPNR